MDTLDETLFGASQPISFGLLSRKLKVPAKEARKLLEEFYAKNKQTLSAAYTVSGYRHSTVPTRVIRIVNASEAQDFASTLKEPVSIEIYALSPHNAADPAVLSGLGDQLRALDGSASLDELKQAGFLLNPLVTSLKGSTPASSSSSTAAPAAATTSAASAASTTAAPAATTSAATPSRPVKKEPTTAKAQAPKEKKEIKTPKQTKAFPFAKASKSEVVAKAFDNKPRAMPVTEKVVVQDIIDDESEDEEPGQRKEQMDGLQNLFDNEDSMEVDVPEAERDMYAEEMEFEPEAEPEEEPEEPEEREEPEAKAEAEPEVEPKAETQPEPAAPAPPKRRRKVFRRTKTTDANGNTITKTEVHFETDDEETPASDSTDKLKEAPGSDSKDKPAASEPSEAKEKPMAKPNLPKIPKKQGPKKQASLMSFFGKK